MADIAHELAAWAAGLRLEDIPAGVLERARLQCASVLGAVLAASGSDLHRATIRAAARWGAGSDATVLPEGLRMPLHSAAFVNASASVQYDFDDYLFAGHTGHSAVVGSIAFGEALGTAGREVVVAQIAANEIAGRLGAAFLLGPHNGQMWAYIHAIAGAVIGGRFLGPDVAAIAHAISIALAQPPFPLAPAFFGPDSKAFLAARPLVDGLRAADLAAEGASGGTGVIEDMLDRIGVKPLRFAFEELGRAWVTESLAYKVVPGCAYVDTPVEAMQQVMEDFEAENGRALRPADVAQIKVSATMFTDGMERMSEPHRLPGKRLRATDVNFSAALSLGVLIARGRLDVPDLQPRALDEVADQVLMIASRTKIEASPEMNTRLSGLNELGIDTLRLFDETYMPTLANADFSRFRMSFPARVTLLTAAGREYAAEVDVPRGAPGRPFLETSVAVARKFLDAATAQIADPPAALEAVTSIDAAADVRDVVARLVRQS